MTLAWMTISLWIIVGRMEGWTRSFRSRDTHHWGGIGVCFGRGRERRCQDPGMSIRRRECLKRSTRASPTFSSLIINLSASCRTPAPTPYAYLLLAKLPSPLCSSDSSEVCDQAASLPRDSSTALRFFHQCESSLERFQRASATTLLLCEA